MRQRPRLVIFCALACITIGACAPTRPSARVPGLDLPYTPEAPMQIVPLADTKYSVDGEPITCEQLGELARRRKPTRLTLVTPGSIADAVCLSSVASELGIRAFFYGADGQLHEIRGHL